MLFRPLQYNNMMLSVENMQTNIYQKKLIQRHAIPHIQRMKNNLYKRKTNKNKINNTSTSRQHIYALLSIRMYGA